MGPLRCKIFMLYESSRVEVRRLGLLGILCMFVAFT
jgi:hypothetical protein